MSRRPRTILWRFGLALMVAQLVIGVVLGGLALRSARRLHHDETTRHLERTAPLLADRYAPLVAESERAKLRSLVNDDARRAGGRVAVFLADGRVIADSHASSTAAAEGPVQPEVDQALAFGRGSSTRASIALGGRAMHYAVAIGDTSPPKAVVRLSLPLGTIDAALDQASLGTIIAGGASLALLFGLIYVISRRLGGQVATLAEGAGRLAAGDLAHRVGRPPTAELAALADALNEIARQHAARIDQLESRQRELQAILQSMSSGVLALDSEQRVLNVNRAAEELLGIRATRARGRLLQEVCRQASLHRFVAAVLEDPHTTTAEISLGSEPELVVQAVAERLAAGQGERPGVLVVLNEISQHSRFESLRSDFAANVSHELRTPITNIKGYVETLMEVGWDDREQAGRFLEIIRTNASRLASIVEDVMALTKLEEPATRDTLEREPTPLRGIVASVLAQYEAAANTKGIEISVNVPDDLDPSVHAHLIEQAIANLVSNAINYSPAGTKVVVSARRRERAVEISVSDDGPGIPPEKLSRVWERFYRVDKARSRELGGTGLGLAIVKHIALIHGGRVEVDSRVGLGSTFTLVLPE